MHQLSEASADKAKVNPEWAEYLRRCDAAELANAAHEAEDAADRHREQAEWEVARYYLHLLDTAQRSGKREDLEAAWSLWGKMSESERLLTR